MEHEVKLYLFTDDIIVYFKKILWDVQKATKTTK